MEVERKFLVPDPPDLDGTEWDEIEQGYLALGADGEVRLRRKAEHRLLTAKRGSGLSREEAEVELDREDFDDLWPLTQGRRLRSWWPRPSSPPRRRPASSSLPAGSARRSQATSAT